MGLWRTYGFMNDHKFYVQMVFQREYSAFEPTFITASLVSLLWKFSCLWMETTVMFILRSVTVYLGKSKCTNYIIYSIITVIFNWFNRLGQVCNYVAALLFYIEHHNGDDKLPTETSKTSKPMTWNQLPKRDNPVRVEDKVCQTKSQWSERIQQCKVVCCSKFDPRLPAHRTLQRNKVTTLLAGIANLCQTLGFNSFWKVQYMYGYNFRLIGIIQVMESCNFQPWNAAMFQRFFTPTTQQCYEYMKLSQTEAESIELLLVDR